MLAKLLNKAKGLHMKQELWDQYLYYNVYSNIPGNVYEMYNCIIEKNLTIRHVNKLPGFAPPGCEPWKRPCWGDTWAAPLTNQMQT